MEFSKSTINPFVVLETPQLVGTYKNESGLGDIELIQVLSHSKGLGSSSTFKEGRLPINLSYETQLY